LGTENDIQYAVSCPHCRAKLKVKASSLGSSKSCPSCQRIFALPSPQAAAQSAAKHEFSFSCRLCQTRIYARPEQIGKQVECPDCRTVNNVLRPPKPVKKQQVVLEEDGYDLQPLEPTLPPSSPAKHVRQFKVKCMTCHTLMYFRTDQVGTIKKCPDCETALRVPKPQPVLKKPVIKAIDPGIGIEPPLAHRSDEESTLRILARAKERVEDKAEREALPPITHPFRDGVWTFPFTLSGLPFCIVSSGVACLIAYLLTMATELTGFASIVGVFIFIIAGIGAALLALLSSVYWMTVVSWTAMGHRAIKEFPPVDMFEWIRTALFVINAGGISVAPGALLAALLPSGIWRPILAIPSLFFLFPIILMSMLEDQSPVSIYSKPIHESLRKCAGSWLKFYSIASVLSVIVAIPHICSFFIESESWNYLAAVFLLVSTVIYFRAFGRLAWVINEKMLVEEEEDAETPAAEPIVPPPLPDGAL
jgi:hypothetical protein